MISAFVAKSYFVHVGGYQIDVEAYQRTVNGPWFIKTRPDATKKDNLLESPGVPLKDRAGSCPAET